MPRKRANRVITDSVVRVLAERPPGHWATLDVITDETGEPFHLVSCAVLFLRNEYGVVEYVRSSTSFGHRVAGRARLVHEKLESYEAGTPQYRPGRLHHPSHLWPEER